MHFQIYLPHLTEGTPQDELRIELIDRGLDQLRERCAFKFLRSGPDDSPGYLCYWQTNKGLSNRDFDPHGWEWLPAIADGDELPEGRYWLGTCKARPPIPEELERPSQLEGELVTLGDGQQWRLPNLHNLPHDMIRTGDGETVYRVQERWSRFKIEANKWLGFFENIQPNDSVSFSVLRDFVESALALNYRLTPELCDRLALWTSGESGTVLHASLAILRPQLTGATA
jgi:hypothetical protein